MAGRRKVYSGASDVIIPIDDISTYYSAWIDEILDEAGKLAVSEMRKNAKQFDSKDSTGELKKSIKKKNSKIKENSIIAGAFAPHAHLLEYGHLLVMHGQVLGHVPAYPFIKPAEKVVMSQLGAIVKEVLGKQSIYISGG